MTWRDDIADRARNGDVDGVLRIYDDLETDRQRVRALNDAYLAEIRRLAGGKPVGITTPAIERAKEQRAERSGDGLWEASARARAVNSDARKGVL